MQPTAFYPGLPPVLASLIEAQAKHETGNFSSPIFTQQNNAFGYSYYPGSNYQLPDPGRVADNGFTTARYQNVADSTREIVDWLGRRVATGKIPALSSITTAADYATILKANGYYGDSIENYTGGLLRYLTAPVAVGAGLLLSLAVVAWLLLRRKK
jgi:hypothetical protein